MKPRRYVYRRLEWPADEDVVVLNLTGYENVVKTFYNYINGNIVFVICRMVVE